MLLHVDILNDAMRMSKVRKGGSCINEMKVMKYGCALNSRICSNLLVFLKVLYDMK